MISRRCAALASPSFREVVVRQPQRIRDPLNEADGRLAESVESIRLELASVDGSGGILEDNHPNNVGDTEAAEPPAESETAHEALPSEQFGVRPKTLHAARGYPESRFQAAAEVAVENTEATDCGTRQSDDPHRRITVVLPKLITKTLLALVRITAILLPEEMKNAKDNETCRQA